MKFIKLDPLTIKKWNRFKKIKRGYISAIIFLTLVVLSLFSEIFINSRALMVKYDGEYFFPTYGKMIPGKVFGLDYQYETNYRDLKKKIDNKNSDNFVIMPIVPYNEYENDLKEGEYPPNPPSTKTKHYLGTDTSGRDVVARLVYGFRIAIAFSLILLFFNYLIGISIGSIMGFYGGKIDLIGQRIIEIWLNVPFLYVIIIVSSIVVPNFFTLIGIMLFFGWMGMTWQMRTQTYKEKAREYSMAAKSLGATDRRIIFKHIIPNAISIIITFVPFSVVAGISGLTSLDYLGFGLPAPTPSWGELLQQGKANLDAIWLSGSVIVSMSLILIMVNFVGEAIREAYDPKQHTTYE